RTRVVAQQERAELGGRVAAEGVRRALEVRPAELPDARGMRAATSRARRVDRVEVGARRRVDAVLARIPVALPAEVRRLAPLQVGFEGDPAVVPRAVEDRAREQNRVRVVLRVLPSVWIRSGPDPRGWNAVEVGVRAD